MVSSPQRCLLSFYAQKVTERSIKRVRYRLINHKHSISHSKSSIEYFRIEAILKTLYTFEEWEDEDSCALAYFGSDLIEAGIKLDFFYNELCVVFNDVVIE